MLEKLNDLLDGRIARLENALRGAHLRALLRMQQLKKTSPKKLYLSLVGGPVLVGVVMLSLAPESSAAHLPGNTQLLHEGQQSAMVQDMLRDLQGRSSREKLETAAEAHGHFMAAQGYGVTDEVDWEQRSRIRQQTESGQAYRIKCPLPQSSQE